MRAGLDAVILSPSGLMGPFDFGPSRLGEALLQLYRQSLPALVQGAYDWVDVRDVVTSALTAETKGQKGERYLVSGTWTSVRELADIAAEVTGKAPPRFNAPLWVARWTAPMMEFWARISGASALYTTESVRVLGENGRFCNDKARAELGHHPRPLRETIADTYAWFHEMGYLDD